MRIDAPAAGLLLILIGARALFAAEVKVNPEDEKAVRQVMKDFTDAGIDHDGKALAVLFRADGDMLTSGGERLSGRTQIENTVKPAQIWSESGPPILRNIHIRFLRLDVAMVDAEQVNYGATVWPTPTFVTFALLKEDGRWQIASCRFLPPTPRSLPWPP
jgi:uncharacterized protein (TIGR02246 family)